MTKTTVVERIWASPGVIVMRSYFRIARILYFGTGESIFNRSGDR